MTAPRRFGPYRVEPRRVPRGAATRLMVRLDRLIEGEWETVSLFDPDEIMWLLPALREAWIESIELQRREGAV